MWELVHRNVVHAMSKSCLGAGKIEYGNLRFLTHFRSIVFSLDSSACGVISSRCCGVGGNLEFLIAGFTELMSMSCLITGDGVGSAP
jgi:hypothetical protein